MIVLLQRFLRRDLPEKSGSKLLTFDVVQDTQNPKHKRAIKTNTVKQTIKHEKQKDLTQTVELDIFYWCPRDSHANRKVSS